MTPVEITQGDSPIVLGLPHTGTFVPDDVLADLNDRGRGLDDTDWHIHQLYDGVLDGATTVRATFHRYVVDANRDPSGVSLYPGQNTTGLVPLTDFDGHDIWTIAPTEVAIEARRQTYHAAYHAALQAELNRVRDIHGIAILYDCHSIRSNIPFLFEGTLPDFNIGTNLGATCAPEIEALTQDICRAAAGYTSITNGRFKGGWTTRHYGRPAEGVHAIQMELAQSTYLRDEAAPWTYDADKSERLRVHLSSILTQLAVLAPTLKGTS
ncbi:MULTISPECIES: N-formylglutamate deformylase [Pacificibacter]|uniref:N-formylglutamate deformylase n=1 Tax=Pacificibacter TaxID=1042323 RepID=UPI001C080FAD|nr:MULTISPECIES: N-formylglutamate deformylase [Pacificibacter]MBU2936386.1 N-formylglutamate deformylase [Pacificibacter marinus]MDO6616573.1 N-formylglutamate deformylase [Pacificibacter sp. 1_MG-2023]